MRGWVDREVSARNIVILSEGKSITLRRKVNSVCRGIDTGLFLVEYITEKLQSSVIHKSQRRSFVQHIRRKRSLKGRHRPPYERAGRLLIQAFHHQKSGKSNMFNCAG